MTSHGLSRKMALLRLTGIKDASNTARRHSWNGRIPDQKRTGRAEVKHARETAPLADWDSTPWRARCWDVEFE
jgi:hypothetical protein